MSQFDKAVLDFCQTAFDHANSLGAGGIWSEILQSDVMPTSDGLCSHENPLDVLSTALTAKMAESLIENFYMDEKGTQSQLPDKVLKILVASQNYIDLYHGGQQEEQEGTIETLEGKFREWLDSHFKGEGDAHYRRAAYCLLPNIGSNVIHPRDILLSIKVFPERIMVTPWLSFNTAKFIESLQTQWLSSETYKTLVYGSV